jgi:hypothetical protein
MRKALTVTATLETLELTPEELNSCRDAVQRMAYFDWIDAGCPESGELEFWLNAEHRWIEHNYVPHRSLDGARPKPGDQPTAGTNQERHEEPIPKDHAVALAHK